MIHIHYFKRVGDWSGYWGLKMCRCGATELHDLWGFPVDPSSEERNAIIEELKGRL